MNQGTVMNIQTLVSAAALALLPQWVAAADGHDHGPASSAAAAPALPRFAAASETFELVGVVDGRQLVVYIDRFTDNSPVKGAAVELEIGGAKVALQERADGELEGTLAGALKPGITPVTATVVAGSETDLLAADLDVHAEERAEAPARSWKPVAAWSAAGVAALALVGWIVQRSRRSRVSQQQGAM
jgi:hypothetical protein